MKASLLAVTAASLLTGGHAFPRAMMDAFMAGELNGRQAVELPPGIVDPLVDGVRTATNGLDLPNPPNSPNGKTMAMFRKRRDELLKLKRKRTTPTFNATSQYIDVTGDHKFVAPDLAGGDQRGPCPGLNALANHNFLPHNGVADIPTIINAVNSVYSMSLDLGTFLAVYGTVFDGNALSLDPGYSIGGYSPDAANILGGLGLLGTPEGLSGSHNKYESDVSPTRGDLYVEGNSYKVVLSRFIDYYNVLPRDQSASQQYEGLADFHGQRFDQSVATNPYFFYSPFSGVLVSPAGYSFPVRMMANHSAEYPDGYLDPKTFQSFFAVYGDDPSNFQYLEGHEQIPANWYKRPESDAYSIPAFLLDVIDHGLKHPQLLSITANAGKVNTPTVIDLGDVTGGVYNTPDLFKPDQLFCFLLQVNQAAAPDLLGNTYSPLTLPKAEKPLLDEIQQLLYGKTCPQLDKVDLALFNQYPGWNKAYDGYPGLTT